MKKYIDELTKRIDELLKTYEQFLWKDKSRKLIVGFHPNQMISFYLYDGEELIDDVYLSFEGDETFFRALCLRTFIIMLGNVMVYKHENQEDNLYYNFAQKPYFAIVSRDEKLNVIIDNLIYNQETEVINKDNPLIREASCKVKKYIPNIGVLHQIDERIDKSKNKLRGY